MPITVRAYHRGPIYEHGAVFEVEDRPTIRPYRPSASAKMRMSTMPTYSLACWAEAHARIADDADPNAGRHAAEAAREAGGEVGVPSEGRVPSRRQPAVRLHAVWGEERARRRRRQGEHYGLQCGRGARTDALCCRSGRGNARTLHADADGAVCCAVMKKGREKRKALCGHSAPPLAMMTAMMRP